MNIRPFRSIIIVVSGAAAIAVLILLIRFLPNGEILKADVEKIRGMCNRDFIVEKPYRLEAARVKRLLANGEIERRRDLEFRSGNFNEGIYIPHPNKKLRDAGIKINIIKVYLRGNKVFEMKMPVIFIPGSVINVAGPEYRVQTCLDLFKNDFVDYL